MTKIPRENITCSSSSSMNDWQVTLSVKIDGTSSDFSSSYEENKDGLVQIVTSLLEESHWKWTGAMVKEWFDVDVELTVTPEILIHMLSASMQIDELLKDNKRYQAAATEAARAD